MWKFILLAMFYGQDGEILHEFRAPIVLNTEAACREMVAKNTFQKTEVEKNGRKYLVEAKADCIYDPPAQEQTAQDQTAQDQTAQSTRGADPPPDDSDRRTTQTTEASAPRDSTGTSSIPIRRDTGEERSSSVPAKPRLKAPPRAREVRASRRPAVRRGDVTATPARPTSTRSARAGGFFDVWPGDVAGPEYDIPGLGRRR